MREIKFRAWDKRQKIMSFVTELIMPNMTISIIPKTSGHTSYWIRGEYILMQFTGLKDKNGEEIYEGDIIETQYGIKHEVIFNDGAWELACTGNRAWTYFNITIIGNIYENPELLEEK